MGLAACGFEDEGGGGGGGGIEAPGSDVEAGIGKPVPGRNWYGTASARAKDLGSMGEPPAETGDNGPLAVFALLREPPVVVETESR